MRIVGTWWAIRTYSFPFPFWIVINRLAAISPILNTISKLMIIMWRISWNLFFSRFCTGWVLVLLLPYFFIMLSFWIWHDQLFQSFSGSLDKNYRASGWQTFIQTPYLWYKCSRFVHTLYGIRYLRGACRVIIRSSWKVSLLVFLEFIVSGLHNYISSCPYISFRFCPNS